MKESATHTLGDQNAPRIARAHQDIGRGGRGRGTERGRGGRGRGAAVALTNGTHAKPAAPLSVPTEESTVWGSTKKEATLDESKPAADSWGVAADSGATATTEAAKAVVSSIIPDGKRTWASIFKKPEPAPKPKKEPAPVEK